MRDAGRERSSTGRTALVVSCGLHLAVALTVWLCLPRDFQFYAGTQFVAATTEAESETDTGPILVFFDEPKRPAPPPPAPAPPTLPPPVPVTPAPTPVAAPATLPPTVTAEAKPVIDGLPPWLRRPAMSESPAIRPAAFVQAASGAGPATDTVRVAEPVVCVVDCSGSMGKGGAWADARGAVLRFIAGLPRGTRVQVVVYNRRPECLRLGGSDAPAVVSPGLVAECDARLRGFTPEGRSEHVSALRSAVSLGARRVVVWSDVSAAEFEKLRRSIVTEPGVRIELVR